MAKLTKQQSRLHAQACELLQKETLTLDDRFYVFENWQEGANHVNGVTGAFFTPSGLARDFALEVSGESIIDLCAGIGSLAFAVYQRGGFDSKDIKLTCVESNPEYVEVGRKLLPEATWITGDVLDLPASIGTFDCAIANPPFGRIGQHTSTPRYRGAEFEYKVLDVARDLAAYGVFLIPQSSAPFRLSGTMCFQEQETEKYLRFREQTSITLEPNCGIDTSIYLKDWHGVSVMTEIVLADFEEARSHCRSERLSTGTDLQRSSWQSPEQISLFPSSLLS